MSVYCLEGWGNTAGRHLYFIKTGGFRAGLIAVFGVGTINFEQNKVLNDFNYAVLHFGVGDLWVGRVCEAAGIVAAFADGFGEGFFGPSKEPGCAGGVCVHELRGTSV